MDFAILADHIVKLKQSEKKYTYLDPLGNRKNIDDESDGDTNYNWFSWYSQQRIGTRDGRLGNKRLCKDDPEYSIVEIGQCKEGSWKLEEMCCYSNTSDNPSACTGVKNSQKRIIIIIIIKAANYLKAKIDET